MVEIQGHLRFLNHHPGTALSIVMINFGTMVVTGMLVSGVGHFAILMALWT